MSSVVSQRNVSERSATAEQFAPVLRVHAEVLRRRVAWQVAIVIGNALLRGATERVGAPSIWGTWTRDTTS